MITFKYQARTPDNRIQSGIVEADNKQEAILALEDRQYEVLKLDPYTGVEKATRSLLTFLNQVKTKELVGAIRMISVMISASMSIVDATKNIAMQTKNPYFKYIMLDIANEVDGGARFSDALAKYPKVFSAFFINMVRSGETTGQLAEVLNYLADQQEHDFDLMQKLKGAFTYPIIIMVGMFITGLVMMIFVVPKLTQVLVETGQKLPWTTKALIATSDFIVGYWWILLIGGVAFSVWFYYWVRTEFGRYHWDLLKMKIPVIGKLLREIYLVRFCQSMATLMNGGLTLVQGLEIAATVLDNAAWENVIKATISSVSDGEALTSIMRRQKFIPQMAVQMISVGEESGKLKDILKRIADFYARDVNNMSANMLTLIEPIVMIVLGLGVGVMVAAIMLPLYNMSSGI